MLAMVGRLLQFVGLLIPPIAIVIELQNRVGLGRSLVLAGVGVALFYLGMALQVDRRN